MQDHDLDTLLQNAPRAEPSAALYGRVLSQMQGPRPFDLRGGWRDALHVLWPFGPAWQPATAFVMMALMGFVLSPTLNPTAPQDEYDLAAASFDTLVLGDDALYGEYQ